MSSAARPPVFVAPVSRRLAVADVARSTAFYRDVLGFEVRGEGVLESGAARITIEAADEAADSRGERRPRGAAILYLEVADVDAARAHVLARGAAPSEAARVNHLKVRAFQLRDPDGHLLWLGRSFHVPDGPTDPARELLHALPDLPVSSVAAAVAHYRDVLGFRINYQQEDLGVMDRDDVTLLLVPRRGPDAGRCGFYVRDADALHAELTARGANVQGQPVSWPWGLRNFSVLDLDGNELTFSQPFE